MSTRNNEISQRIPNPDWHTELPKYYVIEDHPGMMWANAPLTAAKLEYMMREQARMDERRNMLAPDIVARIRRRVEKAMTLD